MNKTPRKYKSHSQIRKYWADFFWEFNNFDSPEEFIETPSCFACGYDWGILAPLEAAHIVARCDGGSDGVDNMVILCRTCHRSQEACIRIRGDKIKTLAWILEQTYEDAALLLLGKAGHHITKFFKTYKLIY